MLKIFCLHFYLSQEKTIDKIPLLLFFTIIFIIYENYSGAPKKRHNFSNIAIGRKIIGTWEAIEKSATNCSKEIVIDKNWCPQNAK